MDSLPWSQFVIYVHGLMARETRVSTRFRPPDKRTDEGQD